MKRTKRTVYLLPDLSKRVDEVAAAGGGSPNAIIEIALDEHFARESMFGAVEALTRRVSELDERVAAQQAMLTKMDAAIGAIGRGMVVVQERLKPAAPPAEQPTQERASEPVSEARPSGFLGGWRR